MDIDDFSLLEQLDEEALQIYLDSTEFLRMDWPDLSNSNIEEYLENLMRRQPLQEIDGIFHDRSEGLGTPEKQTNNFLNKNENCFPCIAKNMQIQAGSMTSIPFDYILDFTDRQPKQVILSVKGWIKFLKKGFKNEKKRVMKKGTHDADLMDCTSSKKLPKKVSFPSIPSFNKPLILNNLDPFMRSFSGPQPFVKQNQIRHPSSPVTIEKTHTSRNAILKGHAEDCTIVRHLTNVGEKSYTILKPSVINNRYLTNSNSLNLCCVNRSILNNHLTKPKFISIRKQTNNVQPLNKVEIDVRGSNLDSKIRPRPSLPSNLRAEEEIALQTSIETYLNTIIYM